MHSWAVKLYLEVGGGIKAAMAVDALFQEFHVLSLRNPFSGISADYIGVVVLFFKLLTTRLSRVAFASSRILVLTSYHVDICVDGEQRTANRRDQSDNSDHHCGD